MDEQRAWIKSRKRKRLRLLAVALCFCLLFTTYPDILASLSVFAAGPQGEDDTLYVSGFVSLPEEVQEQTVPVGTGIEKLSLPDTLEAVIVVAEGEKPSEGIGEETEEPSEDTGKETEEPSEDTEKETENIPEDAGEETGKTPDDTGEETEEPPMDMGEENEISKTEEMEETGAGSPGETDGIGEKTDAEASDAGNEESGDGESVPSEKQENHTVTMPEYYSENVVPVQTLEDTHTEKQEETVTINGITWQSEPEYDANTAGTYLFTAILPEGYAFAEGVSLPQITVMVAEDEKVRLFLERAKALPDLESMIEEAPGEEEEGYKEWKTLFLEAVSEAEALRKIYNAFTETERAQIPEELYASLTAWWEYARLMGETVVYANSGTDWTYDENYVLTIKSDAGMTGWINTGFHSGLSQPEELRSIVIENGVTKIPAGAFWKCSKLVSVKMANTVTDIGDRAFYQCTSLADITIPSGVTNIGEDAFNGCESLTNITIPSSVTSIGETAFYHCSGLQSITIPSGVTSMGTSVFEGCISLQSATIQYGVTSIAGSMFKSCSNLTSVTIPSSVTNIERGAFQSCLKLSSITIPDSVTNMGDHVFAYCDNLTKVKMLSENPPTLDSNAFDGCSFVKSSKKGILVPVGKADTYKSAAGWSSYADYITDGTPQITRQPQSQTVRSGNTATFSVSADGEETLSYQWQVDKKTGSFVNIENAVSSTYTTPAVDIDYNGYKYRCVVTNDRGKATSSEVTLSVTETHTVTYNYSANGGTSATKTSATVIVGGQIDLSPTAKLDGWEFLGWNTNKSARSGLTSMTMGRSDVTLYAIYKKETTITYYSGNAGEYVTSAAIQYNNSASANVTFPVLKNLAVPGLSGYQACGWQSGIISVGDSNTIYEAGKTIAFSKLPSTDWNGLYQKEITVSYDANGGSGEVPESQTTTTYAIVSKDKYTLHTRTIHWVELPEGNGLSRTGYTFNGWIKGQATGTSIAAGKKVGPTADTIYYASWKDETKPDVPVLQDGAVISADWTKTQDSIPLKLYDSARVDGLWVKIDDGGYTEVSGFTGGAGNVSYSYPVTEGEHTYQFYAVDAVGNRSEDSEVFTVKLDKTPPVIDLTDMSVENGVKNLWNWIIGKKNMIIRIPAGDITDAISGIAEVSYTAKTDEGTEQTGTAALRGGNYEIILNTEFTGTIKLTAKDNTGNITQASLTSESGKVIAEDYAPVVTFALPDTLTPNEDGWYNTGFAITVTVTDAKDSAGGAVTSGGITEIKWKDGESGTERTVPGLPGSSPVYEKEFDIDVNTDGIHTCYVQAVDNAGNESGWQTITVRLDTSNPVFSGNLSAVNCTQKSADITFTPSEAGKVYWIVSDAGTAPSAQEVKEQSGQKGGVQDISGGRTDSFPITGLTAGEKYTVFAVLEDVAGNLSEVKEVSFATLQAAPEITLNDLSINHEKETVKLPDNIGDVEVYTNPGNPSGSKIQPKADGSLPVEPGTSIYVRYPEKTDGGETIPASDSVKIDIPGRPAAPASKQTVVTNTTVTVTNPAAGEEYVLVEKGSVPGGQEPDWNNTNQTGQFTGLEPNKEYELYVRKKATKDEFASESAKTEVRTYVTINDPEITGEGAGKNGNTASKPDAPDAGGTVTFTGTYGKEYTPVIIVNGQETIPGSGTPGSKMEWDKNREKGEWEYIYTIPDGASEAGITVEFRKRSITGITVMPDSLTIYADDTTNVSIDALTAYLKENSSVQAAYDNRTEDNTDADYNTTDIFAQKGATYRYTVSAGGKTKDIILVVSSVTASTQAPDAHMQRWKDGGYTEAEVNAWLPTQVTVKYTGTDYTARSESRTVIWDTASIGTDFGGAPGEKTVAGTVVMPAWAMGQDSVSIVIRFVDKTPLNADQIQLALPGFSYGTQKLPGAQGSIAVEDTNPKYTYLYSTDGGNTWIAEGQLPKSDGGYIIPGEYMVKMTYTGDNYVGEKTASFTVTKKLLEVQKGTLEAEDKNYDGNTDASLKESGQPALSGVIAGDTVTLGGSLNAGFAGAGPKKNIPVIVTGFLLEGADAGYYELKNTTLTLYATINNADGTSPSDGGNDDSGNKGGNDDGGSSSGNGGSDNSGSSGGNSGSDNSGNDDNGIGNNGGSAPGGNNASVTSAVTLPPVTVTPAVNTPQPASGTGAVSDQKTGTQSTAEPAGQPGQNIETEGADTLGQSSNALSQKGSGQQPENEAVQAVQASIADDRIVISGATVETGNITETSKTTTRLEVGDGEVIVTVVCEDAHYAAGVKDTAAVANAALTPEQIQLVGAGETIEVRIDVKDISENVAGQDKEIIESGLMEYRKEMPELTLGMYVDISLFIRIGESNWDVVTSTDKPIEVVLGIPEEMKEDGREFYIIRSHEGEYTLLTDTDNAPDTITISTDLFSIYALAYMQADSGNTDIGSSKCSLCHICPTFLGICCFIWLAVIIVLALAIYIIILRKKRQKCN